MKRTSSISVDTGRSPMPRGQKKPPNKEAPWPGAAAGSKRKGNRSNSCPPLGWKLGVGSAGYEVQLSSSLLRTEESAIPTLFTDQGRNVIHDLRKIVHTPVKTQTSLVSTTEGPGFDRAPSSGSAAAPKNFEDTSLPPITMLLKPKTASKMAQKARQQELLEKGISEEQGDTTENLRLALEKLKATAADAQIPVNTAILWKESNFQPPTEKDSEIIKERTRDFKRWRENAFKEIQDKQRAEREEDRVRALTSGAGTTGQAVPPELMLECMESPRLLTEDQAAARLAQAQDLVSTLTKRYNATHELLTRKERVLTKQRSAAIAKPLSLDSTQQLEGELDERYAQVERELEKTRDKLLSVGSESRRRLHMATRLKAMTIVDEQELSDLRESLKNHTADVEKLRLKMLNEIPKVEKGLKNAEIQEARMLLQTMREKHARELEARRQIVRETASLRDKMLSEEQRYLDLTEEVAAQYDPNGNSPRRNDLRHKLQLYMDTFDMMMRKLGDTDIDRLVSLFMGMKGIRQTWEEAVRDAEARCEELRQERDNLQQAAFNVMDKEWGSDQDVERKIREHREKLEKSSEREVTQVERRQKAEKLIGYLDFSIRTALKRFEKVNVRIIYPQRRPDNAHGTEILELMGQWQDTLAFMNQAVEDGAKFGRTASADDREVMEVVEGLILAVERQVEGPRSAGKAASTSSGEGAGRLSQTVKASSEEDGDDDGDDERENKEGAGRHSTSAPSGDQAPAHHRARARALWKKAGGVEPDFLHRVHAARIQQISKDKDKVVESQEREVQVTEEGRVEPLPVSFKTRKLTKTEDTGKDAKRRGGPKPSSDQALPTASAKQLQDAAFAEGDDSPVEGAAEDDGGEESEGPPPLRTRESSLLGATTSGSVRGIQSNTQGFSKDLMEETADEIAWPARRTQRRVKIPKKIRRKDKRYGMEIVTDSESEYSSSSQKSFDYDEVIEELEEVYTERDAMKRRAQKYEKLEGGRKKDKNKKKGAAAAAPAAGAAPAEGQKEEAPAK